MDFKKELPDILGKTVISPLHYGETVEISFVRGIEGETVINGKRFEYQEKNVFFIPPKHLHTSTYRKGGSDKDDMICALHINVDALTPFVDVKKILLKDSRTLFELAFRCDDYDMLWKTAQSMLDESRSFISRVADTLHLFETLLEQKKTDAPVAKYSKVAIDMIEFVEENYGSRLTLQHAAEHFGYSKQYFCKWCKSEIGVAFNEFLNAVRVTHAKSFLTGGCSVEETAEKCGFSDPSYFSKVFKKFVGTTPKAYSLSVAYTV
ncbi:MAG: helix-turn-helix transcriptional regulator [Clostridia bacterium]|nr:helix-turn-helix transcriptional regulator [Clostridia bacterium]